MRRTLLLFAIPLALLILVLVAVRLLADRAIEAGVESGGEHALGVPTELAGVDLGLLSGRLELMGLGVQNPAEFPDHRALTVGRMELDMSFGSLFGDVVEVPLLAFEDVELRLDRRGLKTNVEALLDHLRSQTKGAAGEPAPAPAEGGGKRLLIRELRLDGVRAVLDLWPEEPKIGEVSIELAPIVLQDLDPSGEGMDLAEVADVLLESLLEASFDAGAAQLGADLVGDLEALRSDYEGRADDLRQQAEDLREEGERAVEDLKGIFDR